MSLQDAGGPTLFRHEFTNRSVTAVVANDMLVKFFLFFFLRLSFIDQSLIVSRQVVVDVVGSLASLVLYTGNLVDFNGETFGFRVW